jgi:hypothetical protein
LEKIMATMRVRFSGLCLFHQDAGKVLARVLRALDHRPELWIDPTTAQIDSLRPWVDESECTLEHVGGELRAVPRSLRKYEFAGDNERVAFLNGSPTGPVELPGVASLSAQGGKGGVNTQMEVGAVVTASLGVWDLGPRVEVDWQHKTKGDGSDRIAIWADLLISGAGPFIIDGAQGGWTLTPWTPTAEVRVWILSDDVADTAESTDPTEARHFQHQYHYLMDDFPPLDGWPKMRTPLPKCRRVRGIKRRNLTSTFCPDGQYP